MGEAMRSQPNLQAFDINIHPLNQQLDDAGLLCGKVLIPKRIKSVESVSDLGLRDYRSSGGRRAKWRRRSRASAAEL